MDNLRARYLMIDLAGCVNRLMHKQDKDGDSILLQETQRLLLNTMSAIRDEVLGNDKYRPGNLNAKYTIPERAVL